MDSGNAWVKMPGSYISSKNGSDDFSDVADVATTLFNAAPERMLWGSDWPHPTKTDKLDDVALLDLMASWFATPEAFGLLFVRNPETLFRFT